MIDGETRPTSPARRPDYSTGAVLGERDAEGGGRRRLLGIPSGSRRVVTTAFGNPSATAGLATGVVNGETATLPAPPAAVQLALTPAGTTTAAYVPVTLRLAANKAYLLYLVGSVARGTLNVIAKDISELK